MINKTFWKNRPTLIFGGSGFIGSALKRRLEGLGADVTAPSSGRVDLVNQHPWSPPGTRPKTLFNCAAKVGGIEYTSTRPAECISDNIEISMTVFDIVRNYQNYTSSSLVTLSSACAYPESAPVPTPETALWDGPPTEATGYYGIAKRVQVSMAEAYHKQYGVNSTTLIPTNVYGPGEHSGSRSHVTRAMVDKYQQAMETGDPVTFWGTGEATRDFVYIDDLVDAMLSAAQAHEDMLGVGVYNIGGGIEVSIKELADLIGGLMGYRGDVHWNTTKPNGQPRRLLDISMAWDCLGWKPETPLDEGLVKLIEHVRGE